LFKIVLGGPRIAALAAGLCLASTQAHALTINATFDPTITSSPDAAQIESDINQVVGAYSMFSNPTTVNIYFKLGTSGGDLGQSRVPLYRYTYGEYTGMLAADSAAHPDNGVLATAVANLPFGNSPATTGRPFVIDGPAGGRALGDSSAVGYLGADGVNGHGTFDGMVSLDAIPGDLAWSGPVGPDQYSAISTIFHEVDEVLGIGGGVGSTIGGPFVRSLGTEDLYRYDWFNPGLPSFTADPSAISYFSIDGGAHYWQFFNQDPGGDRSDWAGYSYCSPAYIQDAFGCPGAPDTWLKRNSVESVALQAIGYNLVPEPGTWALMITGFGLMGLALRRRSAPALA
jgi:hypothetical protein